MSPKQTKRAALYLRMSRDGQTVENQRLALKPSRHSADGLLSRSLRTNGISGAKGRDQRPQLDALSEGRHSRALRCRSGVGIGASRAINATMDTLYELEAAHVDLSSISRPSTPRPRPAGCSST
jgi:Resolvase, N terminal domain